MVTPVFRPDMHGRWSFQLYTRSRLIPETRRDYVWPACEAALHRFPSSVIALHRLYTAVGLVASVWDLMYRLIDVEHASSCVIASAEYVRF